MRLNRNEIDMLRAQKELNVLDLASKSKVSPATIYKGYKNKISPVPLGKIAKALGVAPEDIIVKED